MAGSTPANRLGINPVPTEEEAAAIVAAVAMSWPSAAPIEDEGPTPTTWRFSGRWWHRQRGWRR